MHTTKLTNVYVHHNSNCSGKLRLVGIEDTTDQVEVTFAELVEFVGRQLIRQEIGRLEQLTGRAFLQEHLTPRQAVELSILNARSS